MALAVADSLSGAAEALESQDDGKVCNALAVIANAGDAGKNHFGKVLDLAKGTNNIAIKRAALEAVAATCKGQDSQATPVLEEGLTSNDAGIRTAAAHGLGHLKAEGSVAKLSPLLTDSHMLVRNAAMGALAAVGAKAGPEAKTVAANLRAPLLRVDAIRALGKLGKEGASHAEEIAVYLEDSDASVRLSVAEALRNMGDAVPDSVVEKAADLLDHQQDRFRATAALAVGSLGAARAGKYTAKLAKMLRENALTFSSPLLAPNCAAAIALGRLGAEGELLSRYLKSKSGRMRAAVCEAFAEMGKGGVAHASAIAACLEDEDPGVRSAALSALEVLQKAGGLDSSVTAAMDKARAAS